MECPQRTADRAAVFYAVLFAPPRFIDGESEALGGRDETIFAPLCDGPTTQATILRKNCESTKLIETASDKLTTRGNWCGNFQFQSGIVFNASLNDALPRERHCACSSMNPLYTLTTGIISLCLSLIAVAISATSAYYAHFRKRTVLVIHGYDHGDQDNADAIIVFTNAGNVSLVLPLLRLGEIADDNNMRTFLAPERKSAGTRIIAEKRSDERVLLPGKHLEFLLHTEGIQRKKLFFEFETITERGQCLPYSRRFENGLRVRLTPSLLPLQRCLPFRPFRKRLFMEIWKAEELSNHVHKTGLF